MLILGGPSNDLLILKLAKPVKQEVVDPDKKTKVFTKELRQLAMELKKNI